MLAYGLLSITWALVGADADAAERRALRFLADEVPRWSAENKCFSCHNNGDAARALYTAVRLSRTVPARALADTTRWLAQPEQWGKQDRGGPDTNLSLEHIQFSAALVAALDAGLLKSREPLARAAALVAQDQQPDGSWKVDAPGTTGSPATYGACLATHLARRTLHQADPERYRAALARADDWLRGVRLERVLDAAAVLLALEGADDTAARRQRQQGLELIRKGQDRDGGWGPFVNAASEPFDTAVVLLALVPVRDQPEWKERLEKGRAFLKAAQREDGSWPETTRPAGGQSYAQRLSTAGWATLALLNTSTSPATTDWPRWRGPNADGVADGSDLPLRWSQTENVRWSVQLPGWGTSSPVTYGNRVFVTSEVKEGGKKALLTLCFDQATGKEIWRHDFGLGVNQRTHEKSNLAVNTPAVTADALYVAFGNADIARYSHDGKLIWVDRYIPSFGDPKMAWGYAVSPLVLEDAVLFPWDHHTGPCFLIGLDKQTGEIAWKKSRPIGTAHATPLLVEHHGQKDILVVSKNRLTAFDAKTHAELWRYGEGQGPYNGEIISSPVYGDGLVFLQLWRQSAIHAIRLTGRGKPPQPVWISSKPGPVEPSLLYYRGLLYAWMDNGVLVCLDGKTGQEHYRERLGGACNSSPVAGGGRVYLSNNEGTTFVVKAGKKFELLATNRLDERITASPAISGNELIYRTDSHLYCIGRPSGK
jgi:outer membrane protein assembly factor BamB